MHFEINKIKIENKKIAIICTNTFGVRFSEFFTRSTGIDAECYYFDQKDLSINILSACIRDLNNDPDVALIITMPLMGVEQYIHQDKFVRYIPCESLALENEYFVLNANKIISRMKQLKD